MNEDLILKVVSDVIFRLQNSETGKKDFNVISSVSDLMVLRDSLLLSVKYKITPKKI